MDPPEVQPKSEKTDETERSKSYDCGLCDTELIYKIAQELLPGLASSCVDNTTGGIFKSAGSVAVDMRKEMTDYLTQRSETYVAEFLLSENANGLEISENPYDIIITLIDDFSSSKRNMFSRVSEWVLSDRRDDRIDDFVQEMEINGFWLLARRESIASTLLKNVDYKNAFHCNNVCNSEDEIIKHRSECIFRPMDCTNEGCTTRYCAAQKENHEAICPFMILPCEQKCSDFVMRREMDRHCVTICPIKVVNCAFYTVGCKASIPRCNVQQHNADDLSSHLFYIIRNAYKEATDEDLKHRVEQIQSVSNSEKLARARDARALTYLIKESEAKLGPLQVKTRPHDGESPIREDINKNESPTKTDPLPAQVKHESDSPNRESTEKPVITEEEDTNSPIKETSAVKIGENKDKDESSSSVIKENLKEQSQIEREEKKQLQSGEKVNDESTKSTEKEEIRDSSRNDEKDLKKSLEKEEQLSSNNDEEDTKKSLEKETVKESSRGEKEESTKSTNKETVEKEEESMKSPSYSAS